jgi:hypothetical protein
MTPKDWIQIAITLSGMVLGPLLAVRLSLKQFHSQKSWEHKVEAYNKVMGHLAILKHSIRLFHETGIRIIEISPERLQTLNSDYNNARQELERDSIAATLIIDCDTRKAINELINTLETSNADWLTENELHWDAIDKCISAIEAHSAKALKNTA